MVIQENSLACLDYAMKYYCDELPCSEASIIQSRSLIRRPTKESLAMTRDQVRHDNTQPESFLIHIHRCLIAS